MMLITDRESHLHHASHILSFQSTHAILYNHSSKIQRQSLVLSISFLVIINDHVNTLMSLCCTVLIQPLQGKLSPSYSPLNSNLARFIFWLCWHHLALQFFFFPNWVRTYNRGRNIADTKDEQQTDFLKPLFMFQRPPS